MGREQEFPVKITANACTIEEWLGEGTSGDLPWNDIDDG